MVNPNVHDEGVQEEVQTDHHDLGNAAGVVDGARKVRGVCVAGPRVGRKGLGEVAVQVEAAPPEELRTSHGRAKTGDALKDSEYCRSQEGDQN